MRIRAIRFLVASFSVLAIVPGLAHAVVTSETNIDRAGSDYAGYDLDSANPALCKKACEDDSKCKAYTYVKPGVQGPKARCYLKSAAPAASVNNCCVSGVKQTLTQSASSQPVTRQLDRKKSATITRIPRGAAVIAVAPKDPGPLGKGAATGSLNAKSPASYPVCKKSGAGKAIFAIFDHLAEWFGGDINLSAHCGEYERELATGVTLGAAPASAHEPPIWIDMGGQGDLMADSLLCLMKDIGDAPGGKVIRKSTANVGGIGLSIQQVVGLSDFNAAARRAQLYQQVRVCAPVIGCFDTQRQTITVEKRISAPAWPGKMKAGEYPIANSYSLDVKANWADSKFNASTPPITITTPYGSGTLQAKFNYFSSLYPVDTPFDYKKGVKLFFDHPAARSSGTTLAQDSYGRSGIPFILNLTTAHKPPTADCSGKPAGYICIDPVDPAPPPFAWSSQILFGARNAAYDAKPWQPAAAAKWPERPDLDLETPRSFLERGPTANFVASTPVKIKPPVQDLLDMVPAGVRDLIGSIGLVITVTPEFAADYAAQLGLMAREGRMSDCTGKGKEFGGPCSLSEALLYAQTRAEGRMQLKTHINLDIDFNIPSTPFYDPDIHFSDGFTVPIGGPNKGWDPGKPSANNPYANFARAALVTESPTSTPFGQFVKGLSGKSHGDIAEWTDQCLKTQPQNISSPPEPTHEPGAPEDLEPELLPCNICVADLRQNKYKPFVFPEVKAKSYSTPWSCAWQENTGCHDLCSWHKTADGKAVFDVAVKSAVDVVGDRCKSPAPPVIK
ncbi:MAG: PAN domain-containing protein [Parvularculaceae bacterium]